MIGGHLVKRLLDEGYEVRAVDVKPRDKWYQPIWNKNTAVGVGWDLRNLKACVDACMGIDVVFNLAADMGGMGFIEANKLDCMLNVLINTNMLRAAADAENSRVWRYFFSSSACVYRADLQTSPKVIQSDHIGLNEADAYPAMPEDGYGWEKLFSERMCSHYNDETQLETRIARYHNIYGPMGTYEGGREKAPAAICRKVAEAVLTGVHDIEIWGDGEQTRSFTYIDDCIEGTMQLMLSDYGGPVNIGSSEMVTINQLVTIVETIAGVELQRYYNHAAPQGVRGRNSDNTMIRSLLGWEPSTSLIDGLQETYKWVYDQLSSQQ